MKSLFILHRDLHIHDNIGLKECLELSDFVYLVFIFTPEQIKNNDYFSENSFKFMLGALYELSKEVKISFFYKQSDKFISGIIKKLDITDIWEHRDVSPFAKKRQEIHNSICKKNNIKYHLTESITLCPLGYLLNLKKKCYLKFTPFYDNAKTIKIRKSEGISKTLLQKINKKTLDDEIKLTYFKYKFVLNGRTEALKLMKRFKTIENKYSEKRDYPDLDNTSHLSSHLHFCTISPREVYWNIANTVFRKQLYWREFYMYISYYIVNDYSKKSYTLPKMNMIKWSNNIKKLSEWKTGNTGIPIVDVGMRQLLQTGYMHNRLRMICAMYLIFYLSIHWSEGEKWFAQHLTDYSFSNNYGGWTWCAGTEIYSNVYFRVFSMEEQNKRFDKNCIFIKKWVPELCDVSIKEIYNKYVGLKEIRSKRIELIKNSI